MENIIRKCKVVYTAIVSQLNVGKGHSCYHTCINQ